jgi:glutamyl-tRNA reductase
MEAFCKAVWSDRECGNVKTLLNKLSFVEEYVLLRTCNRMALILSLQDANDNSNILLKLLNFNGISANQVSCLSNMAAFVHLVNLVCGHLSQNFGEDEIVAQFKAAFETGRRLWTVGVMLSRVFDFTMQSVRHIRKKINKDKPVTLAESVKDYLLQEQGWPNKKILLVGWGRLGKAIYNMLSSQDNLEVTVANRTPGDHLLSQKRVVSIDSILKRISEFDVVIFATAASYPLINNDSSVNQGDLGTILDLSVPYNVVHDKLHILRISDVCRNRDKERSRAIHIVEQYIEDRQDAIKRIIPNSGFKGF